VKVFFLLCVFAGCRFFHVSRNSLFLFLFLLAATMTTTTLRQTEIELSHLVTLARNPKGKIMSLLHSNVNLDIIHTGSWIPGDFLIWYLFFLLHQQQKIDGDNYFDSAAACDIHMFIWMQSISITVLRIDSRGPYMLILPKQTLRYYPVPPWSSYFWSYLFIASTIIVKCDFRGELTYIYRLKIK
jgi:hypothetical protein